MQGSNHALRPVWLLGLACAGLFVCLALYLAPLAPGVLALQFAFTPRAFAQVIHAWPPEHLARYRAHLPLDGLLLIGYGAFGYLLVARSRLFRHYRPATCRVLRWTLPLAAAFDAAEDALHWWLTEVPRFGVTLPYVASALCSTLKWALLCAFLFAVVRAGIESCSPQ